MYKKKTTTTTHRRIPPALAHRRHTGHLEFQMRSVKRTHIQYTHTRRVHTTHTRHCCSPVVGIIIMHKTDGQRSDDIDMMQEDDRDTTRETKNTDLVVKGG